MTITVDDFRSETTELSRVQELARLCDELRIGGCSGPEIVVTVGRETFDAFPGEPREDAFGHDKLLYEATDGRDLLVMLWCHD